MRFYNPGNYGTSQAHTPSFTESIHYSDKANLKYESSFFVFINDLTPGQIILETTWNYFVISQNMQLYRINSSMNYLISEMETNATNEQLDDIIKQTYKRFRDSFNERSIEFPFFDEMPEFKDQELPILRERLKNILTPLSNK